MSNILLSENEFTIQQETNSNLLDNYFNSEIFQRATNELTKSLLHDNDFTEIFDYFKNEYKLDQNFDELEKDVKLDIMIKAFYIVNTQKYEVLRKLEKYKQIIEIKSKENDELSNQVKNESKMINYQIKCEMENLKMNFEKEKKKYENLRTELDSKKLKMKNKKKTYLTRIEEAEKYIEELEQKIQDQEKKIIEEKKNFYDEKASIAKELKQSKMSYNILIIKYEDIEKNYQILYDKNTELNEINKKLQEKLNLNVHARNSNYDGMNLDEIYINTEENLVLPEKPTNISLEMRIKRKKILNSYSSHPNLRNLKLDETIDGYKTNRSIYKKIESDGLNLSSSNITNDNYQVNSFDNSSYNTYELDKSENTEKIIPDFH